MPKTSLISAQIVFWSYWKICFFSKDRASNGRTELEAAQAAKRQAHREKHRNNMADCDTANEVDVNPKMNFPLEFNQEDPELWFATLERNMLTRGIKSQQPKEAVLLSSQLTSQGPNSLQIPPHKPQWWHALQGPKNQNTQALRPERHRNPGNGGISPTRR